MERPAPSAFAVATLRSWWRTIRKQFIALSERISGQNLSNFFQVWLYTPSKPTSW
jgi:hypothetical protein